MSKEIIIFGFSGSGKSTIANRISERYGLRVVHPSGIIRHLLEGKSIIADQSKHNEGFRESPEGIKMFNDRLLVEEPIDFTVDKILIEEIGKGDVVIDTWNLPWLTDIGIRFYLKADITVRAKRVALRGNISYEHALETITMKDEKTRILFLDHYGFDIKKDYEVFDKIIDTNDLNEDEVFAVMCKYLDEKFNLQD